MTRTRRYLVGAIAAAAVIFATAPAATAQTCTLTLKRRETKSARFDQTDYMYWSVQPQSFYVQLNAEGKGQPRPVISGDKSQADAFKRIVKKEPKYHSEYPFRGVLKLGSQEYAFALDVAAPAPAPEAKKPDAKQTVAKAAKKPAANGDALAALGNLLGWFSGEEPAGKPAIPVEAFCYNRLYFDFNHNGDLTDDKVVEVSPGREGYPPSYRRFEFPRTDVTIDVDGTKLDYSFNLEGYAYSWSGYGQVSIRVSSAICREGDVTLEGKRHHLVLLDYNSNGRFNDQIKISENIHMAAGQLYPEQGDVLLIDPKTGSTPYESPYDPTASDYRYDVSKMVPIDGRWYDLKISPAGDKLTLTPSAVPVGSVTNRNEAYRAQIYGDKGFLKIRGTKGAPIAVPEGRWKLLSYTITCANRPEPAKPAVKAEEKKAEKKPADKAAMAKKSSLLGVLAKQFIETIAGGGEAFVAEPSFVAGPSLVSATATEKYKAVTVRKGETVELPFGPPYTPTVTAESYGPPNVKAEQFELEMGLVGVGGEACTNMMVKGGRPGKPEFTITDPKGKVVQQGSFEYG
jgi:hypothetical protein